MQIMHETIGGRKGIKEKKEACVGGRKVTKRTSRPTIHFRMRPVSRHRGEVEFRDEGMTKMLHSSASEIITIDE